MQLIRYDRCLSLLRTGFQLVQTGSTALQLLCTQNYRVMPCSDPHNIRTSEQHQTTSMQDWSDKLPRQARSGGGRHRRC